MTRLVWNDTGKRFFEAGVDMGVLFTRNANGVPWNGLVSVTEKPVRTDVKEFFIDGVKYAQNSMRGGFEATLEAYQSPEEFDACDGTAAVGQGFYATNQRRTIFDLAYRTRIGNDLEAQNHAYKIHLIYNAVAAPSDRSYSSLNQDIEPATLAWDITTIPLRMQGFQPSSHFIVDSRRADSGALSSLEGILYGTGSTEPRMPSLLEAMSLFQPGAPLFNVVDNGDGSFTVTGPEEMVQIIDSDSFMLNSPTVVMLNETTYQVSSYDP